MILAVAPGARSTRRLLLRSAASVSATSDATLLWSDEFENSTLSNSSWGFVLGDGTGTPAGAGWGNSEAECYVADGDSARVAGGALNLTASYAAAPFQCDNGRGQPATTRRWRSAKLSTQGRRSFVWTADSDLRVEARLLAPTGAGAWPAFWMLPEANEYGGWCDSGEIDIMEHVNGADEPVHGTVHYGGPWPRCDSDGGSARVANLTAGWHVYAALWSPDFIAFEVDGVEYFRSPRSQWWTGAAAAHGPSAPFDRPFYLMLNLAVGGDWPCPLGNCSGTPFERLRSPLTMLVDYVRVWAVPRNARNAVAITPPLPPPPKSNTVTPACEAATPCPAGRFYYCLAGGNADGCSPTAFPSGAGATECSSQCLTGVASLPSSPSPSPSPSPEPNPASASAQAQACEAKTPCPPGRFYYCLTGGNADGCSPTAFPSGPGATECASQCLTAT